MNAKFSAVICGLLLVCAVSSDASSPAATSRLAWLSPEVHQVAVGEVVGVDLHQLESGRWFTEVTLVAEDYGSHSAGDIVVFYTAEGVIERDGRIEVSERTNSSVKSWFTVGECVLVVFKETGNPEEFRANFIQHTRYFSEKPKETSVLHKKTNVDWRSVYDLGGRGLSVSDLLGSISFDLVGTGATLAEWSQANNIANRGMFND